MSKSGQSGSGSSYGYPQPDYPSGRSGAPLPVDSLGYSSYPSQKKDVEIPAGAYVPRGAGGGVGGGGSYSSQMSGGYSNGGGYSAGSGGRGYSSQVSGGYAPSVSGSQRTQVGPYSTDPVSSHYSSQSSYSANSAIRSGGGGGGGGSGGVGVGVGGGGYRAAATGSGYRESAPPVGGGSGSLSSSSMYPAQSSAGQSSYSGGYSQSGYSQAYSSQPATSGGGGGYGKRVDPGVGAGGDYYGNEPLGSGGSYRSIPSESNTYPRGGGVGGGGISGGVGGYDGDVGDYPSSYRGGSAGGGRPVSLAQSYAPVGGRADRSLSGGYYGNGAGVASAGGARSDVRGREGDSGYYPERVDNSRGVGYPASTMPVGGGYRDAPDQPPYASTSKPAVRPERSERFGNKTLVSPQYAQQQQMSRGGYETKKYSDTPADPYETRRYPSGDYREPPSGRDRDWDRDRVRPRAGDFDRDRPRDKFRDDHPTRDVGAPPSAIQGKVRGPKFGDWNCDKCGNMNFARRDNCNRCGEPRKDTGLDSAPLGQMYPAPVATTQDFGVPYSGGSAGGYSGGRGGGSVGGPTRQYPERRERRDRPY